MYLSLSFLGIIPISFEEEIESACCAIEVCCVDALRYGGTDKNIIERLGNDPAHCDYNLDGKLNMGLEQFWGNKTYKLVQALKYWIVNKYT